MSEQVDASPDDPAVLQEVDQLDREITDFKNKLQKFQMEDHNDHDSADLGAVFAQHGKLLELIGYWIGLMDGQKSQQTPLENAELQNLANTITHHIRQLNEANGDSRTLTQNVLYKKSTQNPFRFVEQDIE